MEKYLVPANTISEKSKCVKRRPWKRNLVELNGKVDPSYRHYLSTLIVQSYSETGAFPHKYHVNGEPCQSHVDWFMNGSNDHSRATTRHGVASLEFDSKPQAKIDVGESGHVIVGHVETANEKKMQVPLGAYLASVTKSGCLTVHDFDNLRSSDLKEDEGKQWLHISTCQQIDVVRWNLANQYEIACTSMRSSKVQIFDIGYMSSEPVQVLGKKPNITVHGCNLHKGFTDIAFSSDDKSRLLASDTNGVINIWDRRAPSNLPCSELTTNSTDLLNSIKLSRDNEIVFGATKQGTIFIWDLRGGRSNSTFRNHKEEYHSPLISVKLAHELQKISALKAQSNIVPKEIHSIDIDPSCPYQLAFHLDDGWSGVLDTNKLQVTHIHCPPPPWLDEPNDLGNLSYLKKPCWLPVNSIFVVGSLSSEGLYLLDFYPDPMSPCHVDYNEDMKSAEEATIRTKQNRHLSLSESVTACAAHPLNGTIVAGTKLSSLLVISQ